MLEQLNCPGNSKENLEIVFINTRRTDHHDLELNPQQKRWVRALWEPLANLEANKSCIAIGNIQGDYDFKLLAVDFSQPTCHLKLFKGLSVISDSVLSDMPAGIITFVCDTGQLDSPCVGVACGGSILIYRNMKPYYRYNIPQQDLSQMEISLWNRAAEKKVSLEELVD
uniref:Bardet-Biedl syndrome 1 N-terminal domain-containing protein n=1 Tax=Acrobeloides nanus TaxID=290746 RepID=A0A914DT03_9BILA